MRYNVTFITDKVVLTTSVEATDEDQAHDQALATVSYELGLNLIPIRYQVEYEETEEYA
jgi:hypothetical protein